MVLSFYTPYWDKEQNHFEVKFSKIALNYLTGFFFTDFIASIPINTYILIVGGVDSTAAYINFLKPLKALRSLRVFRLFKTIRRVLFMRIKSKKGNAKPLFQTMDFMKSLIVLANEKNEKITTTNSKSVPLYRPTDIISSVIPNFSPCYLLGLMAVHNNDQPGVKSQLLQMAEDTKIPESVVRGLISLATEEVDSIEDVASALKFDPDAAEGLAFVAGSVTINIDHKSLNSSSSLNKLCIKMGIEQSVIAALLGILNQDYQAGAGKSKTLFVVKTLLLYNTCLQLKTILMNVCFLLQLSMLS